MLFVVVSSLVGVLFVVLVSFFLGGWVVVFVFVN